jgi:hypothetical protein
MAVRLDGLLLGIDHEANKHRQRASHSRDLGKAFHAINVRQGEHRSQSEVVNGL